MESTEIPEQISSNPEITEMDVVDKLPEVLGFLETSELKLIREAAIEAYLAGGAEEAKALRDHYQLVGEAVVNKVLGEEYTKAQIGLTIAMGTLRRDSGKFAVYLDDIEDALMYASGMAYNDIVNVLKRASEEGQAKASLTEDK